EHSTSLLPFRGDCSGIAKSSVKCCYWFLHQTVLLSFMSRPVSQNDFTGMRHCECFLTGRLSPSSDHLWAIFFLLSLCGPGFNRQTLVHWDYHHGKRCSRIVGHLGQGMAELISAEH